jgi:hypothetical protein
VALFLASERERVTAYDRALLGACDAALAELERSVSALRARRVRAHTRGQLLGALALSMSLAGCSQATGEGAGGGSGGASVVAGSGAGVGGEATAGQGAESGRASAGSAAAPVAGAAGAATDGGASGVPAACEAADGAALRQREFSCCGGLQPGAALRVEFDAQGKPVAFTGPDGARVTEEIERCLRQFLGSYCYPSLAGTTQEFMSHCWVA